MLAGRNPFPDGWTPSRLDQGYDGTFRGHARSPFFGRVVFSSQHSQGWGGGGITSLRRKRDGHVYYFAEGIQPRLRAGQLVWPGRRFAVPKVNPFNGVVGNIEWGRANPDSPTQPLAQVVPNKREMVLKFYAWARKLGLGPATDTGQAGFP